MHEIGLCEGIVAAVRRRAGDRPVAKVRIRAGALLRVVEPSLQQAWELLTAGTPAQRATVELVQVPAELHCERCDHQSPTVDALATCPACGSGYVHLSGGDELVLESLTFGPSAGEAAVDAAVEGPAVGGAPAKG